MFQTEWPVLLVDDDPDVLAVSKLAMKSFEIDGVPIKLFTATSEKEAVKLLNGASAARRCHMSASPSSTW